MTLTANRSWNHRRYALAKSDDARTPDEWIIHAEGDAAPIAVVRNEPWPEMYDRPWPDGLKNLPWFPWLMGIGRSTPAVRTVVRRCDDGTSVLRLHRRQPIFNVTIGIFDADDQRIGYCRSDFKSGLVSEFAIATIDHRVVGRVCSANKGRGKHAVDFRLTPTSGGKDWGRFTLTRDKRREVRSCDVVESEGLGDSPAGRIFLLAAVLIGRQMPAP